MRLQILTLLCSLFVLVLATSKLEDKDNIYGLLNAYNIYLDTKEYSKFGDIFTPDAIYEEGLGKASGSLVRGLSAIIDIPKKAIPEAVLSITQSKKVVKFLPPFDKEGRSDRAEAISYTFFTFFGAGNLTGQTYFFYVKYVDKEIVRTKEPGFGGWRIKYRKLETIVSLVNFHKHLCHVSSTPPYCSTEFLQYVVDRSNL